MEKKTKTGGHVNGNTASVATCSAVVEVAVSPQHVFCCSASIIFYKVALCRYYL
jgi:hypothetical protein